MTGWEPATEAEVAMRDALRAQDQQQYFRAADARRSVPAGRGRPGRRMGHLDLRRPHARARLHLRRRAAGQPGGERRHGPPCPLPGAGGRLAQPGVVAGGQPRAADRGLPARLVRRSALPGRRPAARPDHGRPGPAGPGGERGPERSQRRTRVRAPPLGRTRPAGRRSAPCRSARPRFRPQPFRLPPCAASRGAASPGTERPGRDGGRETTSRRRCRYAALRSWDGGCRPCRPAAGSRTGTARAAPTPATNRARTPWTAGSPTCAAAPTSRTPSPPSRRRPTSRRRPPPHRRRPAPSSSPPPVARPGARHRWTRRGGPPTGPPRRPGSPVASRFRVAVR